MLGFLSNFQLDRISFWVGLLTGALLFWFITGFREIWPKLRQMIRMGSATLRQTNLDTTEERLRKETLRQAQGLHLSAGMFALDEILVPPRLMAPLPQVMPGNPLSLDNVVTQTIAYMPEWPELAARFGSPTIDLFQPIHEGVNYVIVGQPGCGKTTALAFLASQISRRESPDPVVNGYLPVLIHAADLGISQKVSPNPWKILIDAVARRFPTPQQSQISALMQATLAEGKLLLLLDGLDDLPPYAIRETASYLDELLKQYPTLHLVTTATPDYFGSLTASGIRPLSLAAWGQPELETFVASWGNAWQAWIAPQIAPPGQIRSADPALIGEWLVSENHFYTPLEWTLVTWAAYAGDSRSSSVLDTLDAFISRHAAGKFRPRLEQLALQSTLDSCPTFAQKLAESTLTEASATRAASDPADTETLLDRLDESKPASTPALPAAPVFDIAGSGLFIRHPGDRTRFIHPWIAGYLAGSMLARGGEGLERLTSQQTWSGKSLALRFLGTTKDISAIVEPYLKDAEGPLYRNLFVVSRWIKHVPETMKWRSAVLQRLSGLIQQDNLPIAVLQRVLSAILVSEDPNLSGLFRQMLFSSSPKNSQIGAIGCGAIREPQSVNDLIVLLSSPNQVLKNAACLALVAIGNQPALEAVTKVLLQADEKTRRSAAEALANDRREGFEILKDGSTSGDILIRRAVVFGLSRIRESWANEILEKMRIEDGQWIIRNAAAQAIESSQQQDPYVPRLLPPAAQAPWLVEYAANLGSGIPGSSDARVMLLSAFKSGIAEERLAALEYLRLIPDPEVIGPIYEAVWSGKEELREAALAVLWELSASGVTLFAPSAYGVVESLAAAGSQDPGLHSIRV